MAWLLPVLPWVLPQVLPGLLTGYQTGVKAARAYRENCDRTAATRAATARVAANARQLAAGEADARAIDALLMEMQQVSAVSEAGVAQARREFYVKAAVLVVACLLAAAASVYAIRSRSRALRSALQDLSQDVSLLQRRAAAGGALPPGA
jgi:hypothetical protein